MGTMDTGNTIKKSLHDWFKEMNSAKIFLLVSLSIVAVTNIIVSLTSIISPQLVIIFVALYVIFISLYWIIVSNIKVKESRYAIKKNEFYLRAITDSAQDGIIIMDQLGAIYYWNASAERILGYTSDEALGKNLHALMVPKRYFSSHSAAFPEFQRTGRGGHGGASGKTMDLHALRKCGTEISIQLSLSNVPMGTGWHSVGIIRDITLQKQAEKELKEAKETAVEATKAKSDFLANMSHEIRTPMNAIIGFSQLVMKTEMTPKQADYISKIDSSANSLLSIINDILDFSKIEAGKLEMESVDFKLDEVMNNIVGMLSVKAADKDIELLSTISKNVPYNLVGDPMRLGQILINLANNAVKFTDKGHILVRAELIERINGHCRLKFTVSDTGIGMTQEQMGKLFAAFSQADASVTRKYGGTGLGLTICQRLVGMMKGEISVESEFGVGSKFIFTAEFNISNEHKEDRIFDIEKFKNLKVLIVDDNEMAREILKEQISDFGMNAATVESGEKAIEELENESDNKPYDLVLMDWRMPGMDGLETARKIIKDKKIKQTPMTIMVSAFGREEIFQKAEKVGVDAFLIKPINQSLLLDTIMQTFGMNKKESITRINNQNDQVDPHNEINGVRALLVEDNALNQEVATEILKSLGVIVDIANNGQEAVNTLESATDSYYDVVLMDIQMPIMDGYKATGLLRSQERFKDLPIIAMTAHALQGVMAECLSAGMSDYVSKPIDVDYLFAAIKKWAKPNKDSNANSAKVEMEKETKINLPESIEGIDIDSGLKRIGGNRKLYNKLLSDFLRDYSNSSNEIKEKLDQNDTETALRLAHTIKGIAGNLSLTDIQSVAADLETAISQRTINRYPPLLLKLGSALKLFEKLIKDFLKTEDKNIKESESAQGTNETKDSTTPGEIPVDVSKPKSIDIAEAEPLLQKLAQLVWDNDVDAKNSFYKLQKVFGEPNFADEMKIISDRISNYDFDSVKEPLQKIAHELNVSIEGTK